MSPSMTHNVSVYAIDCEYPINLVKDKQLNVYKSQLSLGVMLFVIDGFVEWKEFDCIEKF